MRLYILPAVSIVKMSSPCQVLLCLLCNLKRAACTGVHVHADPIWPPTLLSDKTARHARCPSLPDSEELLLPNPKWSWSLYQS